MKYRSGQRYVYIKRQSIFMFFMTITTLDLERQLNAYPSHFFAEGGAGNFVVVVGFFSSGFDALEPIMKNPSSPFGLSIL